MASAPDGAPAIRITPSMTWHDHSNETSEPMLWLDGLDIPMVQFFDASFAEGSNETSRRSRAACDSFARYGHNCCRSTPGALKNLADFNYPYSYTREALEQAKVRNDGTPARVETEISIPKPAILRCRPSAPSSSCCRRD